MRTDDEEYADGPSAAAVLAVADGLRRRDPQLSAALAEHAARLAHGGGTRGEAEVSAVLARRELDRPDEVVGRGMPSLLAAEDEGRGRDAAVLRCALVDAALALGDVAVAEALLEPVVTAGGLPEHVRLVVAVARADLAAALGDVAAADTVADEAAGLSATREEQLLARTDLDLARARARRAAGEHGAARDVLRGLVDEPVPEPVDGGRRHVLAVCELVEAELDLGDATAARATAAPVLDRLGDVGTALPLARLRCLLAARVHLPVGEHAQAAALARAAGDVLAGRGHDRHVAAAEEVLADVAEARDDLRAALEARRRAHHLERDALLAQGAVRVALAAGLRTSVAASPSATARAEEVLPVASRAMAGRARAGASVASRSAAPRGDDPAPGVPGTPLPDRHDGASGRRRARAEAEEQARVDGDAAEDAGALDARSAVRGPAPHGLSRILEEITADAVAETGAAPRSLGSLRDLESGSAGALADGRGANGHGANGHGSNGHRVNGRGVDGQRPDAHDAGGHGTEGHAPLAVDRPEPPGAGQDGTGTDDEYAHELRLTLVDLLAEYGGEQPSRPSAPAGGAPAPAPTAAAERAAPLTAWSFHDSPTTPTSPTSPTAPTSAAPAGSANGVANTPASTPAGAGPDSGARLADLLAEAMDAFRRTAPGNGSIGAGPVPDHRGQQRSDHRTDRRTDHRTERWGVRR